MIKIKSTVKTLLITMFIMISIIILGFYSYDILSKKSNNKNYFTFTEDFEECLSMPGELVNSDVQGNGGDGVYAIASWDGFLYDDREVYINDQIVYSGSRSLRHEADREDAVGSYTGVESQISPGPGDFDPHQGDEMWARMMIYVPEETDWRNGINGNESRAEPKIFRVFWRSDHWLTTYLQVSRGGDLEPDWYKNKYPTGIAVGIRFEIDHDPIFNYGASAPWSIDFTNSTFTYIAPFDNNYTNFIIPYNKWVSLEHYVFFNNDSSKGKSRFWLDEVLVYEQTIDTWTSQERNAPYDVISIQSLSTWRDLPTTKAIFYTDDYIITNDPAEASKLDAFGNKMIGNHPAALKISENFNI